MSIRPEFITPHAGDHSVIEDSAMCTFTTAPADMPRSFQGEVPCPVTETGVIEEALAGLQERLGVVVPKLTAAAVVRIAEAAWAAKPAYPGIPRCWWAVRGGGFVDLRPGVAHEEPEALLTALRLTHAPEKPAGVNLGKGYVGPLAYRGAKLLRPAPLG